MRYDINNDEMINLNEANLLFNSIMKSHLDKIKIDMNNDINNNNNNKNNIKENKRNDNNDNNNDINNNNDNSSLSLSKEKVKFLLKEFLNSNDNLTLKKFKEFLLDFVINYNNNNNEESNNKNNNNQREVKIKKF
jgi:hypothetical protein